VFIYLKGGTNPYILKVHVGALVVLHGLSQMLFWKQDRQAEDIYLSVPLIRPLRKYAPPLFTAKVPACIG